MKKISAFASLLLVMFVYGVMVAGMAPSRPLLEVLVFGAIIQALFAFSFSGKSEFLIMIVCLIAMSGAHFFLVPLGLEDIRGDMTHRMYAGVAKLVKSGTWVGSAGVLVIVAYWCILQLKDAFSSQVNENPTPEQSEFESKLSALVRSYADDARINFSTKADGVYKDAQTQHAFSKFKAAPQEQRSNDGFLVSLVVGAVTGSSLFGYAAGGSLVGGFAGAGLSGSSSDLTVSGSSDSCTSDSYSSDSFSSDSSSCDSGSSSSPSSD